MTADDLELQIVQHMGEGKPKITDQKNFNDICVKTMEGCFETLGVKQGEYNMTEDRLDQFKKCAAMIRKHPMEVCGGFMLKHTSSIYDLIERTAKGEQVGIGMWQEKIIDHINYLLLLMALAVENQ